MTNKPITADAILWDFDGTLADSAAKNIAITKLIMKEVSPQLTGDNLPDWLKSESAYHQANHGAKNWRDLYRNYFGMQTADIEAAGPMWETFQASNETAIDLFDGILETLQALSDIPMGVSSANSSGNINRVLNNHNITSHFRSVVGYETFHADKQKPAAEPGLQCLNEVLDDHVGKTIVYVGDHIADVIFSRNIAARLGPSSTVISVIVTYSGAEPERWRMQPDVVIASPTELVEQFGS